MEVRSGWNENRALLRGVAAAAPEFSHENHGVSYEIFPLAVRRLSGAEDRVNVVAASPLLEYCPVTPGAELEVRGEVRSFNNRAGEGNRLVITLFARMLAPSQAEHVNHLTLTGVICKPPILRRTPLGREICDMMLAVNRKYGRADYLPCIAWGTLAQKCGALSVGESVRLEGRLQSRTYQKLVDGEPRERVAFEISVMRLEREECRDET